MMTLSAIQYCMIVIRNWLLNTEFLWLTCLQINLPTRSIRLMQLVEQDLLVLPKFTQDVCNAESLVFCLMFCWSLFVIFFFFVITLSVLIRFTASGVSFDIFIRFPTVIMSLLQLKTFKTYQCYCSCCWYRLKKYTKMKELISCVHWF
jgi:hypothetical protein